MEEVVKQTEELKLDEELQWLKDEVLGHSVSVTLPDDRVVSGKLQCVDHQGNIVIGEAIEHIPKFNIDRTLGLAIAPGIHIKKLCLNPES